MKTATKSAPARPVTSASTGLVFRIVLDILNEYEIKGTRLDWLLRRAVHSHRQRIGSPEKAKINKTVSNIIRWRSRIDYVISRMLKLNAGQIEPTIRNVYRICVFNMVYLRKSVELTCSISEHILAGNGDVRSAVRHFVKALHLTYDQIPWPNPDKNLVQAWAVIHAHPEWMIEKLVARYGARSAEKIMEFNNRDAAVHVRVNTLKSSRQAVKSELEAMGLKVEPLAHAAMGYAIDGPVAAFTTPAFLAGSFEMQDEASQVFVEWCDPAMHSQVLDACAGSGGKALYMAALMKNTGRIVAYDSNGSALAELKKRAARAGAFNIEIHKNVETFGTDTFDLVLIDAPCSGIGTLRRNPDIKWNLHASDVANLTREQEQILNRVSGLVRPGGVLIYATCTLLPEENEERIDHFVAEHSDFRVIHPPSPFNDEDGLFRIRPDVHGISGFFACQLKRN